ncbi:hypothetical protein L0Y49_03655 [bacterium]|nr:hypothetical protein [bacterium]MCI0565954.1 hypothetical protein [bacterium]MCI0679898.1 hypothetical protein [bacterium]
MAETSDYTPSSHWSGYDYKTERKNYDAHAGRSKAAAQVKGTTLKDLLPKSITTKSRYPVVVNIDHSGSMCGWPGPIVGKFPYLFHQLQNQYLGPDMEISFGYIGDMSDEYPIQQRPFAGEKDVEERVNELVVCNGGGGGGDCDGPAERYDVSLLYLARNIYIPDDATGIAITCGDEMPYNYTERGVAERFFIKIDGEKISIEDIIREVKKRHVLYHIVAETGSYGPETAAKILKKWQALLGKEYVATLDKPDRIVDVIFGILGVERNMYDYFQEEIERRQTPEQVATVYRGIENIVAARGLKRLPPRTILTGLTGGTKAQPLLTKKK